MFESINDPETTTSGGSPKRGTWGSMNAIQKTGLIAAAPFIFLSWSFDGKAAEILGLIGWTSMLMGYVAGNFWRYRHALHFWWSTLVASILHAFLLPAYAKLVHLAQIENGGRGKGYFQLTFLLLIVETLTLQIFLKRIAMLIHRWQHPFWQERPHSGTR